jgi:myo-inositol-1(or 4)-monophosphatase
LFRQELAAIQGKVAGLRRFGAAALDLAWIAAGRIDGYWERNIAAWDLAAGTLLVREAGGFISDLEGGDAMLAKGTVVAGNEAIHRQLLSALKASAVT